MVLPRALKTQSWLPDLNAPKPSSAKLKLPPPRPTIPFQERQEGLRCYTAMFLNYISLKTLQHSNPVRHLFLVESLLHSSMNAEAPKILKQPETGSSLNWHLFYKGAAFFWLPEKGTLI